MAPEALFASEAFAPGSTAQLVKKRADAVGAVITAEDGTSFGFTDGFLSGRRIEVRRQETNLGNLTANANPAEAKKTDPKGARCDQEQRRPPSLDRCRRRYVDRGGGASSQQP